MCAMQLTVRLVSNIISLLYLWCWLKRLIQCKWPAVFNKRRAAEGPHRGWRIWRAGCPHTLTEGIKRGEKGLGVLQVCSIRRSRSTSRSRRSIGRSHDIKKNWRRPPEISARHPVIFSLALTLLGSPSRAPQSSDAAVSARIGTEQSQKKSLAPPKSVQEHFLGVQVTFFKNTF